MMLLLRIRICRLLAGPGVLLTNVSFVPVCGGDFRKAENEMGFAKR